MPQYCNYSFKDLCNAAYTSPEDSITAYNNLKKIMLVQEELNKEVLRLVKKAGWHSKTVVRGGVVYEAFSPKKII